jgi:hypothetical protein
MQGVPIREGVVAKNYLLRMIHVVALTFSLIGVYTMC